MTCKELGASSVRGGLVTESENRVRTRNTVRLVVALIVAAMIVIAQLPPINRWSGHNYLIWGAIAVVAVDYLRLAVRRRNPIYAALLVYTVAVLVGAIAEEAVDPPRAVMIGVAVGSWLPASSPSLSLRGRVCVARSSTASSSPRHRPSRSSRRCSRSSRLHSCTTGCRLPCLTRTRS